MSKILFAQTLGFNPKIAKEFWSMLKNHTHHEIYSMVLDKNRVGKSWEVVKNTLDITYFLDLREKFNYCFMK